MDVAYGFCLRQPTQFPQGRLVNIGHDTGSCNELNITKSERRVENALRLVNHPVNLTPMWDRLLRSSDSTYASGRKHTVEFRTHSLSDVRTDRNNATEHAAEIAVASHRAAEIE